MEIRQIFLSYSRPDQDQVEQIATGLDREGYRVWYDQASIVPGESWSDALERGLRESSHCLVFVGPGEVRPWQREEIRTAINRAVSEVKDFRLIPVLLPGVKVRPGDSETPSFLSNRQWVEFRESLDNEDDWRRLIRGLQGKEPGFDLPAGQVAECPYQGLGVFGIDDAVYFYGREAVTETVLTRLRERITQPGRPRFFAIIGPSGTGKSSLVRAGVLAGIVERGVLDDCGKWIHTPLIFKPGELPLNALAKKLIAHEDTGPRFKTWSVAELEARMRETENGECRFLADEIEAVLPEGSYLAVLVDQFEEMLKPLAMSNNPAGEAQERIEAYKRDQFLPFVQSLAFAAGQERGRLVFMVTMRDDFYGLCVSDDLLRALVSENHHLLAPMSTAELNASVERPARKSGKAVQPALLTLIEMDMRNRPGALPLLQEALEQVWHRSGNTLTSDIYTELGGITGSLEKKADEIYNSLVNESKQSPDTRRHREGLIRRIFLDLVNRGSGVASSRRRERSELSDDPDTQSVLDAFVDAHLLLESGDKDTGKSYYELTHEALIEHWSKLHDWLKGEEDDRFRQQLEEEANRWSNEREQHKEQADEWQQLEPEYLLRGQRWHKVEQWLNRNDIPVSERADRFVDRCRSYSDQQRRGRWKKGFLAAIILMSVVSGLIISIFYLTHTYVDPLVSNVSGKTIDDYEVYASKDHSTLDVSRIRWFSLGLLEPDQQYWLRIQSNGYFTWEREIQTAHAGDTMQIEVALSPFQEPEMERITGGSFLMGSDPKVDSDTLGDERPRHEVTIETFNMSKYEVTFEEYEAFVNATNRDLPDDDGWGRGRRPVINVSWDDAVDYTEWLSEQTGKHFRLPTEAEWEYAARAGTGTKYWWGNALRQDGKVWANCDGCGSQWGGKQTAPVGSFKPNDFGVYDTAGNVWEWVQDCWHDSYEGSPDDGSAWEAAGGADYCERVIRGGSWFSKPGFLRSTYRDRDFQVKRDDGLGFRLAQDKE